MLRLFVYHFRIGIMGTGYSSPAGLVPQQELGKRKSYFHLKIEFILKIKGRGVSMLNQLLCILVRDLMG